MISPRQGSNFIHLCIPHNPQHNARHMIDYYNRAWTEIQMTLLQISSSFHCTRAPRLEGLGPTRNFFALSKYLCISIYLIFFSKSTLKSPNILAGLIYSNDIYKTMGLMCGCNFFEMKIRKNTQLLFFMLVRAPHRIAWCTMRARAPHFGKHWLTPQSSSLACLSCSCHN